MARARLSLRLPLPLQIPFTATFALSLPFTARPYSSSANQPQVTRYLVRRPSPAAPRECPTPLVFVRAKGLLPDQDQDGRAEEEKVWNDWSGMFAEKGYTALEVDITAAGAGVQAASGSQTRSQPESALDGSSATAPTESPLKAMTTLLASQIRLLAIPFPPILIASGASCLLTQAYIEDNPASGLVLVSPPPDEDPSPSSPRASSSGRAGERVWKWPTFGYEGTFPILLLGEEGGQSQSRLGKMAEKGVGRGGKGVSLEGLVDGPRGEKSRVVSRACPRFVGDFADGGDRPSRGGWIGAGGDSDEDDDDTQALFHSVSCRSLAMHWSRLRKPPRPAHAEIRTHTCYAYMHLE